MFKTNTTEKLVKLLQPYLPDEYKDLSHEVLDGSLLFNIILWLLTHTKEGKPVKDGDVPCILGGEVEKEENTKVFANGIQISEVNSKTKARAFLSYENLTLATMEKVGDKTGFEVFKVLLIEELENDKE